MFNIGFIGIGVMGGPIAGHLSNAGNKIKVYNRTVSKTDEWLKIYKGVKADNPLEAAKNSDFVFVACSAFSFA